MIEYIFKVSMKIKLISCLFIGGTQRSNHLCHIYELDHKREFLLHLSAK